MITQDMVTCATEKIEAIWDEAVPLFERHWQEIAHWHDIPLVPDKQLYLRMGELHYLRVYTARIDGKLIGYAFYMVKPNPHYMTSLQATQDVLFIIPEHRRGSVGTQLLKFSEQELKKMGVQAVYQHVKVAHNFGPLLIRLGYEHVEHIYAKRLDGVV